MSFERVRELACTYFYVDCCCKQRQLCYRDRPDRITTCCGCNSIGDGTRCIKGMSFERVRELACTYFYVDCCCKQRQLGHRDRPDRITTTSRGCYCIGNG